jgi:hypothetical protein
MGMMERAAALIDARDSKIFQRVGDLLEMPLRKVQILRGGLEILMAKQQLDGAQVGAGFEQVRGPAVTEGLLVLLMICIQQKFAMSSIPSMVSKLR